MKQIGFIPLRQYQQCSIPLESVPFPTLIPFMPDSVAESIAQKYVWEDCLDNVENRRRLCQQILTFYSTYCVVEVVRTLITSKPENLNLINVNVAKL